MNTELSLNPLIRHTRESGYPSFSVAYWIPAYAGMTESESLGILAGLSLNPLIRHTRESGYPSFSVAYWIPAYAGMTESESPDWKISNSPQ